RVVNKAAGQSTVQDAYEDDALLGFRPAQQRAAEQERPRQPAQEPVFTELEGNFSTEEEPVIPWEDDLGPARVVKSAVVVKPVAKPPVAESLSEHSDAEANTAAEDSAEVNPAEYMSAEKSPGYAGVQLGHNQKIHASAAQARSEHPVEDLDIPPSPLIPKARPVNLDEQFPVLLDVEELGDDDIKPQVEDDSVDVEPVVNSSVADTPVSDEAEVSADPQEDNLPELEDPEHIDDPHLEQEFEKLPSELPLQPVNFAGANAESLASRGIPELVLEIHAIARDPAGFSGKDVLFLFNSCDLRFGEKDIFHRFEQADGEGCIQFSVAQSYEPGIFVPAAMAQQHFRGLSFFMSLPGAKKPLEAYEAMSEMALVVARKLRADVYDGARSALTPQTMEHDRQQIMDFERRQRLALKKQAK
ncbi:cell division protein ZipA C-terminal FtsZ-binding domain-containing protein, partial [Thalassolituus sp. UBA2009]|uniref:cell division protein ZipA C-terminal FtsZ-binding domain-containing protein n=1 Tax=Thalassolituus sp. UBA2009 TaxID=1947658 RepID=UPI00257E0EC2